MVTVREAEPAPRLSDERLVERMRDGERDLFEGHAMPDVFVFYAPRCDRVVDGVLGAIRRTSSPS